MLEGAKHDVDWAGDWNEDPGDDEILRRAREQGRVLATLDKDFGELAVAQGMTHSGIIRLVGIRARDQGPTLAEILQSYESELRSGALITVEPGRVRVRSAGSDGG